MKPVTDPNILMQLNGDGQRQPRPVTDPRILMQLDGVPEETANLLGDPRSVWETSGADQLPAIREQVMGGKPLAQAVAAQPPVPRAAQPAPKPQTLSNSDYLTGLLGQTAQGLTLGYFDEGLAAGASALGINDYEENLRRIRGLDKQFVAENPVTSFAANVVGGIPLGGPLTKAGAGLLGAVAPNAARAVGAGTATAGQRVAGGLATGAAAGTVAGSGTAEGDLADRAYGAGMGGLLGAGLGGAIPAVTSAASGAGSAALRAMPFLRDINLAGYRPFTSAQDRADQLVGQAMARGGDQGAAEAAMSGAVKSQIAQPGTASVADTVLGDVSPELRSLTGAVLRSPGAGAAKAREFIATRQEGIPLANVPGQGSRLADEVSAVGGKINLRDTLDTIVEQRSAAAKPLFDQAFQVGNVINPTLSRIAQDGAVKRALAKGVVLGKRAGDIPPEYKLVIGDTVEAIPARVWHYAKMALDDQISGLRQTGKGVEARSATILKTNLINGLDEATGGAYKPALNDFAGRSALLDAAEEGRKAIASNVGPDDIQRMVSGFQTQGERDLFSQAYKSSLANMMASASRTRNAADKALLSDQQVAKIRAAFPADQADEIIQRASVRDAQFKTYAETKGSPTQFRQMAERDIENNIQSGISAAGAVANPKGYMIGRAMEWLSNVPARAMSEKVRNALAERLVNPDPRKVATALKAVEAAAKREASRLKVVTDNRQFLSRNAAATAAMDTLGPGVSGAANMVGDAWQQGDAGDRISMLSSLTPLGDIVGPINDARNFASGKTPMTAENLSLAAVGALPLVPSVTGAMFLGATARTAEKSSLKAAQSLAAKGARPDLILDRTGWTQGVDGKWRFELDDSKARVLSGTASMLGPKPLADILDHKQLFAAYPKLKNVKVEMKAMPENNFGSFDGKRIEVNRSLSDDEKLSTILHEIQHWIQGREGFSPGTNTNAMINSKDVARVSKEIDFIRQALAELKPKADAAREAFDKWMIKQRLDRGLAYEPPPSGGVPTKLRTPQQREFARLYPEEYRAIMDYDAMVERLYSRSASADDIAWDRYRAAAGEVEARNVQTRRAMTDAERRASHPRLTEDVSRATQLMPKKVPWYSDLGAIWGRPKAPQYAMSAKARER